MRGLIYGWLLAALALATAVAQGNNAARVTLGGVIILEFRAAAGGMTPEQRASEMQNRIVEILSRPELKPEDVKVTPGKGGKWATINVGPIVLVTVTEADARANRTTPVKLATIWAENFRRGFREARPRPNPPR